MIPHTPMSTRTDTLFPYTTLFQSIPALCADIGGNRRRLPGTEPFGVNFGRVRNPSNEHISPIIGLRRHTFREAERSSAGDRSEEHTSELQSLMRISYAVYCLKKKQKQNQIQLNIIITHRRNI